jgi:uridine kinase
MRGDVLVIEPQHRRAAAEVANALLAPIAAKPARFVIAVAGESGSGKSEMAAALAECLSQDGIMSVTLGQDDYFVLPPKANDARRRSDPDWLGPHVEVRLEVMQSNIDAAVAGASQIDKPVIDYDANAVTTEVVGLGGIKVVIAEGTYVSLLRHIDCRVFIGRNRLDTLEHRKKRNRGGEAHDAFVEGVLGLEHKIIAGHRQLADFVITRDFEVVKVQ